MPIDKAVKYYIEAKMPLTEPQAETKKGGVDTWNECRKTNPPIKGNIADVGVDNKELKKVEETERYALYRSSEPAVFITKTLDPDEPRPTLPGTYTFVQAVPGGFEQPFAYAEEKIKGPSVPVLKVEVKAEGATKITEVKGDEDIIHFVTPKGGATDKVTLTATINPDTPEIRKKIKWDGADPDPKDPLKATVPKNATARYIVKIKLDGQVLKELRVWVVWATGDPDNTVPVHLIRGAVQDQHTPPQTGVGTGVSTTWEFEFTIVPLTMLTDANRPDFTGNKTVNPPPGIHITSGRFLTEGAKLKWDVSRRVRLRALSPTVGTEWFSNEIVKGAVYDNLPNANRIQEDYPPPADDAKGNDDTHTGDEDNTPDADGKVSSVDPVRWPVVRDAGGSIGDTIEFRLHFGEFLRLQVGGAWKRVSKFVDWRVHARLKKASEAADNQDYNGDGDKTDILWINNASVSDATNNGWE